MPQQACEACYRNKSRCQLDRVGQPCLRCSRLGQACHPRARKRMGRRAIAKQFSHGSSEVLVLDLDSTSAAAGKRCQPGSTDARTARHDTADVAFARGDKYFGSTPGNTSPEISVPTRLGWMQGRLDMTLGNLSIINPFGSINTNRQVRWMLEDRDCFYAHHRYFLLGRSFTSSYQSTVLVLLRRSPMILTSAYYAVFELMHGRRSWSPGEPEDGNLEKGVTSLQDLFRASASIQHMMDAAVVVVLGQILIAYNLLIAWPCTHLIAKNTLLAARGWYACLTRQPELDCITLTSVFVDTIQCLVRREMPIVQYTWNGPAPPVDRFIGLCSSLLPLLYRLCERSYAAKSKKDSRLRVDQAEDWYAVVECQIGGWEPPLSPQFDTIYSRSEASRMLSQARVYRTAALLIIHRLRYPPGTQDHLGRCYAESILRELSVMKEWDPADPSGFGVNFPLLVASLEMPEVAEGIVGLTEPLAFDCGHSQRIMNFVRYVELERNRGFKGSWFELVEDGFNLYRVTLP